MTTAVPRRMRITSMHLFCAILLVAIVARPLIVEGLSQPVLRTAATVFVAVCIQALPFLVLGVLLSGAIAAFVSPAMLRRLLPAAPGLVVPVAGLAGVALPGCECASVPVARRLMAQGVPDAAALTFLLAAPAVNPVVLVATAVAFPGEPRMVLARFVGSLATACVMGWLWQHLGRPDWVIARSRARRSSARGGWCGPRPPVMTWSPPGVSSCSEARSPPCSRSSCRRRGRRRWPTGRCSPWP